MRSTPTLVLGIVGTVIVTALVIYLTPLKHVNLVEPSINEIESVALYQAMQENPDDYLFIDVRPDRFYNELHADGSENIMLHRLYFERENLPKSGKTIALICSGEGSPASGVAYSYLEHHGFFNIVRVAGGIEAWQEAGLPVAANTESAQSGDVQDTN